MLEVKCAPAYFFALPNVSSGDAPHRYLKCDHGRILVLSDKSSVSAVPPVPLTAHSHAQKYLSLIEKAANQERKTKRQKRGDQVAQTGVHVFQPGVDFTADETFRDIFEFRNVGYQIDGNRRYREMFRRR